MTPRGFLRPAGLLPAALATAALLAAPGCAGRPPQQVGEATYGVTREPFHGRWWQYCERGVSWANGGFLAEAEADLRRCLALRQTDSRRARTYGMHFIQCFAHRELGAVLLAQDRLDEAAAELRISIADEPSAKAEFLLRAIADRRQGARGLPPPAAAPAAPAAPAAVGAAVAAGGPPSQDVALALAGARVAIDRLEPAAAGGQAQMSGRLLAPIGLPLWAIAPDGGLRAVAVDEHGGFSVALAPGDALGGGRPAPAAGSAPRVRVLLNAPSARAQAQLRLDGPADGGQLAGSPAWFRFEASAPGALAELRVSDERGTVLSTAALSGIACGGMVGVPLEPGEHRLGFALRLADGTVETVERRLRILPAPRQDARWRAPALLEPLQESRIGQPMRAEDPPLYERALVHERRFSLVDPAAAGLRQRELAWADAGFITPTTAVARGHEVHARYVVLGTITRGRDDAECFVRLVSCETGGVVAAADAYDRVGSEYSDLAFFAAVAGRLRQAFPVHAGRFAELDGHAVIDLGAADGVAAGLRFHVLLAQDAPVPAGDFTVVSCGPHRSLIEWLVPAPRASGEAVSE